MRTEPQRGTSRIFYRHPKLSFLTSMVQVLLTHGSYLLTFLTFWDSLIFGSHGNRFRAGLPLSSWKDGGGAGGLNLPPTVPFTPASRHFP